MTYNYWLLLFLAYILLTVLVTPLFITLYKYRRPKYRNVENILIFSFAVFYILALGLRDSEIGTDTVRYIYFFRDAASYSTYTEYFEGARNAGVGLFFLAKLAHIFTSDSQFFLLLTAILYISLVLLVIYRATDRARFVYFFAFFSCFFFYSMGYNVLKSGIALMLMLLGVMMDLKDKKIKWLYFALGFMFHASTILVLLAWFGVKKFNNLKLANVVWILCVVLSIGGIGITTIQRAIDISFINSFIEMYGYTKYMEGDADYTVGFRFDFTVFSGIFMLVGNWVVQKTKNVDYQRIFLSFIYLNSFFILAYDMPYSDRIGALSWVLIPFIIGKPLIEEIPNHYFRKKFFLWYLLLLCLGVFSFMLKYPNS